MNPEYWSTYLLLIPFDALRVKAKNDRWTPGFGWIYCFLLQGRNEPWRREYCCHSKHWLPYLGLQESTTHRRAALNPRSRPAQTVPRYSTWPAETFQMENNQINKYSIFNTNKWTFDTLNYSLVSLLHDLASFTTFSETVTPKLKAHWIIMSNIRNSYSFTALVQLLSTY